MNANARDAAIRALRAFDSAALVASAVEESVGGDPRDRSVQVARRARDEAALVAATLALRALQRGAM